MKRMSKRDREVKDKKRGRERKREREKRACRGETREKDHVTFIRDDYNWNLNYISLFKVFIYPILKHVNRLRLHHITWKSVPLVYYSVCKTVLCYIRPKAFTF